MRHTLRRFFQKGGIFLYKKFVPNGRKRLNKKETSASIILRRVLTNPESELSRQVSEDILEGGADRYLIKHPSKSILIILSNDKISITNNVYGHDVSIPIHLYKSLCKDISKEESKRRSELINEYDNNIHRNLKDILKDLD